MTTQATRQLSINITATNTWTQLKDLATGNDYVVPAGARTDLKWLRAIDYGANQVTVEFAISTNNTITDNERIIPPIPLTTNESLFDDSGSVMADGWALWARAVGTTPNATFLAFGLEITP